MRIKSVTLLFLLLSSISFAEGIEWKTAQTNSTMGKIVFRYISKYPSDFDRSKLTKRVIIQWKYQGENGMPKTNLLKTMFSFEDLIRVKSEEGKFSTNAVTSTGDNMREWIFYTKNDKEFLSRLNIALEGHPKYPITILVGDDPTWLAYQDVIKLYGK